MHIGFLNFLKVGQSIAKILQFLVFIKMATVRHLGFVWGKFGPHTESIYSSLFTILCRKRNKLENAWHAYSPLGAIVSPPSEY